MRSCGRSANRISLIRHKRPGESRRRTGENRPRTAQVDSAIRSPLAALAVFLDRLGRHEPAATIASYALGPLTAALPEISTAIAHLRDVLGDQVYESLARKGETMTTAEMATYAHDQIDQARAELNAVSK